MDSYTLARQYAPVIYQKIDVRKMGRDLLTNFNFDGCWDFKNNISNAKKIDSKKLDCDLLIPTIYFATAETHTHHYILYVIFHMYGMYPNRILETGHTRENDCKGILLILEKQTNKNTLLGVGIHRPNTRVRHHSLDLITKTEEEHTFEFFSFQSGINPYDWKTSNKISVDESEPKYHKPRLEITKKFHTIKPADVHDSYSEKGSTGFLSRISNSKYEKVVMYKSNLTNIPSIQKRDQILKQKNQVLQYDYQLVSISDPKNGILNKWDNRDIFYDERNFNASKFAKDLVNAPWIWGYPQYLRIDNEGMPTRIWDDPAYYVHTKVRPRRNGKEFNRNYMKHMAQE